MGKKRLIIPVAVLLVVFLLAYIKYSGNVGTAGGKKDPPANKPVAVKTAAAVPGAISPSLTLSGTVAGEKETVITAKTQGILISLLARTGQRVAAGQAVALLESENQQLALEKSREQVNAAGSALEKAKADFARIAELYKQGAVSRADYENAELALKNAQAAYNAAVSDSRLADRQIRDATVAAPFSGSVAECFVEEGEMIFPSTRLMTLVDDSRLKIKANLTADQLKLVSEGSKGIFTTGVVSGKEFACTVKSISTRANPVNLTYAAELTLSQDAGDLLKPGMFGHVRLETKEIPGLIIPREALVTRDESGNAELFAVKDGKAVLKSVTTGLSDDRNIIVLGGLQPGEKVVTFGQSLLKDGSLVTEGE
ncbi:MAG: efflux RND transporter periplasmic adaptor subunit [Peptococcaceae bacterium]|nr:efflux RND transporter periplasmic adaptor subunit [Peptococcaceae bacterium]